MMVNPWPVMKCTECEHVHSLRVKEVLFGENDCPDCGADADNRRAAYDPFTESSLSQ